MHKNSANRTVIKETGNLAVNVEERVTAANVGQEFHAATSLDLMLEYSRYLYENELARTDKLNDTSKTFILFISSTFTVLLAGLTWVGVDVLSKQTDTIYNPANLAAASLFLVSVLALVLAFVFVVLSVKIRSFERLCDPLQFVSANGDKSTDLIKKDITANYTVATARNYKVNARKAWWLFNALFAYLAALVLFLAFLGAMLLLFVF